MLDAAAKERIRHEAEKTLRAIGATPGIPTDLDAILRLRGLPPPKPLLAHHPALSTLHANFVSTVLPLVAGLIVYDIRQIFLDFNEPKDRLRFILGHELGHEIIPWHRASYLTGNLREETAAYLEEQSDFFSRELLFQGGAFTEAAIAAGGGLLAPVALAPRWGVSFHSAIHRYVETNPASLGLLMLSRAGGAPRRIWRLRRSFAQSEAFIRDVGTLDRFIPPLLHLDEWGIARRGAELLRDPSDIKDVESGTLRLANGLAFSYEMTTNGYTVFVLLRPR